MDDKLILRNRLKQVRSEKKLSQAQLAELVGVSRNTISSIETGQFNPTAKLALILCIALDTKFEDLFYFCNMFSPGRILSDRFSYLTGFIRRTDLPAHNGRWPGCSACSCRSCCRIWQRRRHALRKDGFQCATSSRYGCQGRSSLYRVPVL